MAVATAALALPRSPRLPEAPRPASSGRGLLAVITAVAAIAVVQAVGIGPFIKSQQQSKASSPAAQIAGPPAPPNPQQQIKVEKGPQANEIAITFPAGTSALVAQAAVIPFDLLLVSGDPATGRYLFALPQVEVTAASPGTATITFPLEASAAAMRQFLAANQLRLIRWYHRAAEDQVWARVALPALAPPAPNALRTTLPLGLSAAFVASWARLHGLRLLQYNPLTGTTLLQPAVPYSAPVYPPAYLTPPAIIKHVHPLPRPRPVDLTPQTVPPAAQPAVPKATLYIGFAPGATPQDIQKIADTNNLQLTNLGTTGLMVATVDATQAAALKQLLSDNPQVACVADSQSACVPPSTATAPSGSTTSGTGSGATSGTTTSRTTSGTTTSGTTSGTTPSGTTTSGTTPGSTTSGSTTSAAPTVSADALPAEGRLTGTVTLTVGVASTAGPVTVNFSISGPLGSAPTMTVQATPSPTDPTQYTATQSWDSTQVADGTYTLTVTATDASGKTTTIQRVYRVQNAAPSTPTQLAAQTTQSGVALTWQQPVVAQAKLYRLFRDDADLTLAFGGLSADERAFVDARAAGGLHHYRLVLVDQDNHDSAPALIDVTVPADSTSKPAMAPLVGMALLTSAGQPLRRGGLVRDRVELRAQELPASAPLQFQYSADGQTWQAVPSPAMCTDVCSTSWQLSGMPAGRYLVRAQTPDASAASLPASFIYEPGAPPDNAPPQRQPLGSPSTAPIAPSGLTMTTSGSTARLSWTAASDPSTTYDVYRVDPSGGGLVLAASSLSQSSFTDTGLQNGKTYGYVVTSQNGAGQESAYSSPIWQRTDAAPVTTTPVFISPSDAQASLFSGSVLPLLVALSADAGVAGVGFSFQPVSGTSWTELPDAFPFNIPAAQSPGLSGLGGSIWGSTWTTSGLPAGQYVVRVIVTDSLARTAQQTQTVRVGSTNPRAPPATVDLQATPISTGVRLTWTPAGGTEFQVLRSQLGSSGPFEAIGTTTGGEFLDRDLVPGIAYSYQVIQTQPASASSAVVQAIPMAPADANGTIPFGGGSLSIDRADRLEAIDIVPQVSAPLMAPGLTQQGLAYTISASSLSSAQAVAQFIQPATLSLAVPSSAIGRTGLAIYQWDSVAQTWDALTSTLSGSVVSTTVAGPGIFALVSGQPRHIPSPSRNSEGDATGKSTGTSTVAPGLVELRDQWTRTSRVYRNPDGSRTTQLFGNAVNYQDASGAWQTIDSSLVTGADGSWQNKANAFTVKLSPTLSGDYQSIQVGGQTYGFSLEGASTRTGQRLGLTGLTYSGIFPGVAMTDSVTSSGVNETLVLSDALAPSSYRFHLSLPPVSNLQAAQQSDGSWAFFDGGAKAPGFVLQPAQAYDQPLEAGEQPLHAGHATMTVTRDAHGFVIDMAIDPAWLRDPSRRYPVILDPSFTIQPDLMDAYWHWNVPTDGPQWDTSNFLHIGDSDQSIDRSTFQFDFSKLPAGISITSAQLGLYYNGHCIGTVNPCGQYHTLEAHRLTSAWNYYSTTASLTYDTTALSSVPVNVSGPNQWYYWDVTPAAQNWYSGAWPNDGLLVFRNPDNVLGVSGPEFPSSYYSTSFDATMAPELNLTWTAPNGVTTPGPPTNVTGTPADGQVTVSWSPPANTGGTVITKVQVGPFTEAYSGSSNITLTLPVASAAGNLLVASIMTSSTAGFTAGPAGWVRATSKSWGNGDAEIWYYANNPGSITSTSFTVSASDYKAGVMSEWKGAGNLDVFGSGTTGTASTSFSVSSASTANTGDLAITAFDMYLSGGGSLTKTPGAGWTNLGSDSSSTNWTHETFDYFLGAGSGITSETETAGATVTWDAVIAQFAPTGGGVIGKVQVGSLAQAWSGDSNPALTLPVASTAGNLLVASIMTDSTAGFTAGPPGWVRATSQSWSSGDAEIWYYLNNPGGITSATFSASTTNYRAGVLSEWAGAGGLDVVGSSSTGTLSTSFPVSSASTPDSGDLAITAFDMYRSGGGSVTRTPGAGWTNLAGDTSTDWLHETFDYLLGAGSGVTSETETASPAVTWDAVIALFRPTVSSYTLTAYNASGQPVLFQGATRARITRVQVGSLAEAWSTGSNPVLTLPVASTAGNLLVASIMTDSTAGFTAGPPGWVRATNKSWAYGDAEIWYYLNNPGGITSATFSASTSSYRAGVLSEWQGAGGLDAVGSSSTGATSTSYYASSASTANSGDLAITAFDMYLSGGGSLTKTPGAGWTNLGSDSSSTAWLHETFDYLLGAGSGVTSETETASPAVTWDAVIALFTPRLQGNGSAQYVYHQTLCGACTSETVNLPNGYEYQFGVIANAAGGSSSETRSTWVIMPPDISFSSASPNQSVYAVGQAVTFTMTIANHTADDDMAMSNIVSNSIYDAAGGAPMTMDGNPCKSSTTPTCTFNGTTLTIGNFTLLRNTSHIFSWTGVLQGQNSGCLQVPAPATATTATNLTSSAFYWMVVCDSGLGLENWWTYAPFDTGPQSQALVNVANGNLVLQQDDTTAIQAHGRFAYVLRRTYNSQDAGILGNLPGKFGNGWVLNVDDLSDGGIGASGLIVPQLQNVDPVVNPLSVTLIDRDGTRHVFTFKGLGASIQALDLGAGAGTGPLQPVTLGLSQGQTQQGFHLCVDQTFQAPPGVHLGLWRYVAVGPGGSCMTPSGGSPVIIGFAGERPDRIRYEFSADGHMTDMRDGNGVDLRYQYVSSPLGGIVPGTAGLGPLMAIYEPRSCNDPFQNPKCRAFRFSYSVNETDISDPANRVTRYFFNLSGYLTKVINPDGSNITYSYCGGVAGLLQQLCSMSDPNGGTTSFSYNQAGSNQPTLGGINVPGQVTGVTDRRGVQTTFSYSRGYLNWNPYPTLGYVNGSTTENQVGEQHGFYSIDAVGRVGERDDGVDGNNNWIERTFTTWDTQNSTCRQPDSAIDNNPCEIWKPSLNSQTPDQDTRYMFNDEGQLLREERYTPNAGADLFTTYGYHTQYFESTGTVNTYDDTVDGGGDVHSDSSSSTAAWKIAQSPTPVIAGSVSSATLSFASNVTAGNVIVCFAKAGDGNSATSVSISDNLPGSGTWVALTPQFGQPPSGDKRGWYKVLQVSGPMTITITGDDLSDTVRILAREYVPPTASVAPDAAAPVTLHLTTSVASASVGPTPSLHPGDLVLGATSDSGTSITVSAGSSTPNADLLKLDNNANGFIALDDNLNWSGGPATAAFGYSPSAFGPDAFIAALSSGARNDANALFAISDKTQMLSPNGNNPNAAYDEINAGAARSGYRNYLTTYVVDDNSNSNPNAIPSSTTCNYPSRPTVNTGNVCEVDGPAFDGIHPTVTRYTYDTFGQRLTMTTPKEIAENPHWSFVQSHYNVLSSGTNDGGYGGTSLSDSFAMPVTAGNRIIAAVSLYTSSTTQPTATNVTGNGVTMTKLATALAGGSTHSEVSVWSAVASASGTYTVTVTANVASDIALSIAEYSGLSSVANPLDVQAAGTGTSGNPSSGATPSTTAADEMVLGVYGDTGVGKTMTAGPGYTARVGYYWTDDNHFWTDTISTYLEDQDSGPSGSTASCQWISNTTNNWTCLALVFKLATPASSGTPYTYTYYSDGTQANNYTDCDTDLSGTVCAGGWLKGVTDPNGNFVAYAYDAAGNVTRTWDRNATKGYTLSQFPGSISSPTNSSYSEVLHDGTIGHSLTLHLTNDNEGPASTEREASNAEVHGESSSASLVGTATGWGELYSQGSTIAWAALPTEPSPSAHGWIQWDTTQLEGQTIRAGTWSPQLRLSLSTAGTVTADIHVRAYRYASSSSLYYPIGDFVDAAQSITSTVTNYTFSGSASAADFNNGDRLYLDVLLNITASTAAAGATISIYMNESSNGEQVSTPGYGATNSTAFGPYLTSLADAGGGLLGLGGRQLTLPGGNSEASAATPIGTATGWGEVFASGTGSAWPAASAEPSPTGNGWILDSPALEGQTLDGGGWQVSSLKLGLSTTGTVTADIHARVYKRSSAGGYSLIGEFVQPGAAITSANPIFTFSGTTSSATSFGSGDKLYLDLILNVTANTSLTGSAISAFMNSISVRERILSPGSKPTSQSAYSFPWRYVTSSRDALTNLTTFTNDLNGNVLATRPPRGNAANSSAYDVSQTFDAGDNLLTRQMPAEEDRNKKYTYTYDNWSNLTAVRDPLGNYTVTQYDTLNRPIHQITTRGPWPSDTSQVPAGCRQSTSSDSPMPSGRILCSTTTAYDNLNNPIAVTDASGATTSYLYDAFHRKIEQLVPRNDGSINSTLTEYVYDADGNLTDTCSPREFTEGGSTGCVDPGYYSQHTTYDSAGRPSLTTTYRQADQAGYTELIQNGGFETGMTGWTAGGTPTPTTSTAQAHSGSSSAVIGPTTTAAPNQDPWIYQTVTIPSSATKATLSFWYWPHSDTSGNQNADQEAYIRDANGNGLEQVMGPDLNAQTWTPVSFDMTRYAGQTVQIYFDAQQDGSGDKTSMYLDDVSLKVQSAASSNLLGTNNGQNKNGNFETGSLSPWTTFGVQPAQVTNAKAHTGTYSALLGWTASPEAQGESGMRQQVSIPATATRAILTFWYYPTSTDTSNKDSQQAWILDTNLNPLAQVLDVTAANNQTWIPVGYDLSQFIGKTIVLAFMVQGNQSSGQTSMYVDDAALTYVNCANVGGGTDTNCADVQTASNLSQASTTSYSYDADGNRISVTDPNGNTTTDAFNYLDRRVSETTAIGNTTNWNYDPAGNITSMVRPGNLITAYSVDAAERPVDTVQGSDNLVAASAGVATGGTNTRTRLLYDADSHVIGTLPANAFASSTTNPDPSFMQATNYDSDGRPTNLYAPRFDSGAHSDLGLSTTQANQCAPGVSSPQVGAYPSGVGVCITQATYDWDGQRHEVLLPTAGRTYPQFVRSNTFPIANSYGAQTFSQSGTAGDLALIGAVIKNGAQTPAISGITDSGGNTWSKIGEAVTADSVVVDLWAAYSIVAFTSITVTFGGSSSGGTLSGHLGYLEYSHLATSPLDTSATATSNGATSESVSTSGSVHAGELAVSMIGFWNNQASVTSVSPGYQWIEHLNTGQASNDQTLEMPDIMSTTTGVQTASWTTTNAVNSGQVIAVFKPVNNRYIAYNYTDDHLLQSLDSPDPTASGNRVVSMSYLYDADGRPVKITDALGHVKTISYFADGLTNQVCEPPNVSPTQTHCTSYKYDANGNPVAVTDARNLTTQYTYYADNKLADIKDAVVPPDDTHYVYDLGGRTTSVCSPSCMARDSTNPSGTPTTYVYNADNSLASSTQPFKGDGSQLYKTIYGYNGAGQKVSQDTELVNSSGGVITDPGAQTFTYYANDRLHTQTGRGGTATITDAYDANGNLTSGTDSTNSNGSVTSTFYLDNRARTVDNGTKKNEYTYNGSGQTAARADITDSSGATASSQTYSYGDADLPTSMTASNPSGTTSWLYDAGGNQVRENDPNGQFTTSAYNPDNTLCQKVLYNSSGNPGNPPYPCNASGTGILNSWTYTYDADFHITQQATPSVTTSYQYDNANRVSYYCTTGSCPNPTYTYDADGNRKQDGNGNSHTYNANDSINTFTPSGGAAQTFSYTAFGGLVSDGGGTTFGYDGHDRMTSAGSSSYAYDALDRQQTAAGTAVNYDGFSQTPAIETVSGSDRIYALDPFGMPKALQNGSTSEYLTDDGHGNVATTTSSTQSVNCGLQYNPWGKPNGQSTSNPCSAGVGAGSTQDDMFYRTFRRDATTGDYQFGNRTYDPTKAGYLTSDVFRTGTPEQNEALQLDPLTMDRYNYVNGDPVNLMDPDGHRVCDPDYCGRSRGNSSSSTPSDTGNSSSNANSGAATAPARQSSGQPVCRAGHGCGYGWSGEYEPAVAASDLPLMGEAFPSWSANGRLRTGQRGEAFLSESRADQGNALNPCYNVNNPAQIIAQSSPLCQPRRKGNLNPGCVTVIGGALAWGCERYDLANDNISGLLGDPLLGSRGGAAAAREAEKAAAAAEGAAGEGIVYLRTDLSGGLKPYIGQAKNFDRFVARRGEHAADHPDAVFRFDILEQNISTSDLDRYEQFYINAYGGPTLRSGNFTGELSNGRNQMSWERYIAAGGDNGIS